MPKRGGFDTAMLKRAQRQVEGGEPAAVRKRREPTCAAEQRLRFLSLQ